VGDPLSGISKTLAGETKFWVQDIVPLGKINAVIGLDGHVIAFFIEGSLEDFLPLVSERPVINIKVIDGKFAFPCFFETLTIIFPDGRRSVFSANYFGDENLQKILQGINLGGEGWSLGDRFVIINWIQQWAAGNVILTFTYMGRLYLLVPSATVNHTLNTMSDKSWHTHPAKKAFFAIAGLALIGGAGYGLFQGANILNKRQKEQKEANMKNLLNAISSKMETNTD
jgi:hypothetical protein